MAEFVVEAVKAPDRIWDFWPHDGGNAVVWREPCPFPADDADVFEYIRHDLHLSAVAEALGPWVSLRDESRGLAGFHLNGDEANWDEFELPELPADAIAALEARDRQVREDALREAAVICNQSYGGSIGDVHKAILALIKGDTNEC
jgi:hypothetical protein